MQNAKIKSKHADIRNTSQTSNHKPQTSNQQRPPMTRSDALTLLKEYTKSDALLKHMYAVEGAMRAYARKNNEDEETWGITGLLHDFDYEMYPNAPDHPLKGSRSEERRVGK